MPCDGAAALWPVLELGCGSGRDTATLAAAGIRVVGLDRIARTRSSGRESPCLARSSTSPTCAIRFRWRSARVVIASLSLHYFAWAETVDIVERIREVLNGEGLLDLPLELDARSPLRRERSPAHRRRLLPRERATEALLRPVGRGATVRRLAHAVARRTNHRPLRTAESRVGGGRRDHAAT